MTTDTVAAPRAWTERDVKAAVWRHLTAQGYAVLDEVSTSDAAAGQHLFRRIDLLAVRGAKKLGIGPHELLAVEVKVTRGDFLNDVRHPEKQAPWRDLAHRHAYAVPAGLVDPSEVPDGSGLLTVDDTTPGWDKVAWAKRVRFTDKRTLLPSRMVTAWLYDLARYQSLERGLNPMVADESVGELQAKVKRLEKDLENSQRARHRAEETAGAWRLYAKGLTGAPCTVCGQELRAGRRDRHGIGGFRWKHPVKAHEDACREQRYERDRQDHLKWLRDSHERHPAAYPGPLPDPDTFVLPHWHDPGPQPADHPDEETPA